MFFVKNIIFRKIVKSTPIPFLKGQLQGIIRLTISDAAHNCAKPARPPTRSPARPPAWSPARALARLVARPPLALPPARFLDRSPEPRKLDFRGCENE